MTRRSDLTAAPAALPSPDFMIVVTFSQIQGESHHDHETQGAWGGDAAVGRA
jgi:hypothetical protein